MAGEHGEGRHPSDKAGRRARSCHAFRCKRGLLVRAAHSCSTYHSLMHDNNGAEAVVYCIL
eukprot:6491656-Amphidinium_carterae.6